ncbi:MAG TPA: hypothetical protein VFI31_27935, partial [Pirellulales bacterium]|nr:hypothetical protein [Pirellulales bacterium]
MLRVVLLVVVAVAFAFAASLTYSAEIALDHDNVVIAADTTVSSGSYQVADRDDNGVLRVH